MDPLQFEKVKSFGGFIAALDQSGGSTPKALKLYGLDESHYSNESEMFDLVHQMRTRIIKSPVFNGDRILGVILFEMTMNRTIEGLATAEYLWQKKNIVPFLKLDNGLLPEIDGVQLMKPIPELFERLNSATSHGVFGTKMRSVIKVANANGVAKVVRQQFDFAKEILGQGLMPIIEPEVDINSLDKFAAETILKSAILNQLSDLKKDEQIMLKLTLPDQANFYEDLADHPKVLRVLALSGGYPREKANLLLAQNLKMIASFSRALTEGLTAQQSDAQFDQFLDNSIETIYQASVKVGF
jgi:fructose-bisphosphate aldolase class I